MSSQQSFTSTASDKRFNKNEKMVPTSGSGINIQVNSIEELSKDEKIKQWTDLITQHIFDTILFSKMIQNDPFTIEIPMPAVWVEKDESGNDRSIVYNTNKMEMNKLYEIEFKNERWALLKNEKTVQFMKFYPDKNE
jgi:hypothetical protein